MTLLLNDNNNINSHTQALFHHMRAQMNWCVATLRQLQQRSAMRKLAMMGQSVTAGKQSSVQ
jgi:hypothetical protein